MDTDKIEFFVNMFLKIASFFKLDGILFNRKTETESAATVEEEEVPYFFKDYKKHVTIYPNGNGIIINQATMVVKDKKKLKYVYRRLNIEDGKKDSVFPSLKVMSNTMKTDRFDKFGFWYYSQDNIFTDAEEWYWSDTDPNEEDQKIKENRKEIRWRFSIDKGKVVENKEYHIEYAICVEGMCPIENGMFSPSVANDPNSSRRSSSSISILQEMMHFTYEVSFDDSIQLQGEPTCAVCRLSKQENIPVEGDRKDNIFYKKYIFNVESPVLESIVRVSWKFKEREV